MKPDYDIFARISYNELIHQEKISNSDTETDKSDKESVKSDNDQYFSDEEAKNNYSFLENFKKPQRKKMNKRKQSKSVPLIVMEEYIPD